MLNFEKCHNYAFLNFQTSEFLIDSEIFEFEVPGVPEAPKVPEVFELRAQSQLVSGTSFK